MIYDKPIAFILQPDDLTHRCGYLDHSSHIMLTHLGHYFINAF